MKESLRERWNYGKGLLGKDPGGVLLFAAVSFLLGLAGFFTWTTHRSIEARTPGLIREAIAEHNKRQTSDFESKGAVEYAAKRLAFYATKGQEIASFNMAQPKTRINGYTVMRLDLNLKGGERKHLLLGLWGEVLRDISVLERDP